MAKLIGTASFIAILAAGLMVPASELSAGPRGGHHAAPMALRAPAARAIARTPSYRAVKRGGLTRAHSAHHRDRGRPWTTGWWTTGSYDGYYAPSNYTMLHDQPAEPASPAPNGGSGQGSAGAPERPVHTIIYRPGCSSESTTIAGADDKDHTITVVRC